MNFQICLVPQPSQSIRRVVASCTERDDRMPRVVVSPTKLPRLASEPSQFHPHATPTLRTPARHLTPPSDLKAFDLSPVPDRPTTPLPSPLPSAADPPPAVLTRHSTRRSLRSSTPAAHIMAGGNKKGTGTKVRHAHTLAHGISWNLMRTRAVTTTPLCAVHPSHTSLSCVSPSLLLTLMS